MELTLFMYWMAILCSIMFHVRVRAIPFLNMTEFAVFGRV